MSHGLAHNVLSASVVMVVRASTSSAQRVDALNTGGTQLTPDLADTLPNGQMSLAAKKTTR